MKILTLVSIFLIYSAMNAQMCNPDSLITTQIRASNTDSNISWELYEHYSFYNPTCVSKNTLLVHLVGSYDNPSSTTLFPELAANNGFHVVSLKYPNSTAAQSACGNSSDPNCYLNFRKEIIEGVDYSTETSVDSSDCINNRLIKLLQYLDDNNSGENWNNYFSGNTTGWNNIIISGHSQGGGHAAVIAINKPVKRVLMFASPNDYSTFFNAPATWTTTTHLANDSAYYGFNNLNDDVVDFSGQFETWNNLGMTAFGNSINVETSTSPYLNSHQLYTSYDTTGIGGNHSVMILDSKTPLDNFGKPLFEPVWKHMLGIYEASSFVSPGNIGVEQIIAYPNPFENSFFIQLNTRLKEQYTLQIFDVLGQLKLATTINGEKVIEFEGSTFEKGFYIVQLTSSSKVVTTTTLIKK